MKITLYVIGKTDNSHIKSLTKVYEQRLQHYINFTLEVIPDIKNVKNLSQSQQKTAEGDALLKKLHTSDFLCILDEKGKTFTSEGFASFLQKKMNSGLKNLVFVIGGPYGFSDTMYQRANAKISLSSMTFSPDGSPVFYGTIIPRVYDFKK